MSDYNKHGLLPCPFCGSTDAPKIVASYDNQYYWRAWCNDTLGTGCGAATALRVSSTYKDGHPATDWNRRTESLS